MISFQNIGELYSFYANSSVSPATPMNKLASFDTLHSLRLAGSDKVSVADGRWARALGRAQQGAAIASYVPVTAFKVPEILFGTGLNSRGLVDVTTKDRLKQHAKDCVLSPCDSGWAGLSLGMNTGLCMSVGAVLGASVGFVVAGINGVAGNFLGMERSGKELVKSFAATGAASGVVLGGIVGLCQALLLLNILRTVLSASKIVVTAPFAAVGYVAGGLSGLVA